MKTKFGALILFSVVFFTNCNLDDCVNGVGDYTSKSYSINDVESIVVNGFADVEIVKGETALTIEAQANVLKALNVTSVGGVLEIGDDNCFKNSKKLKITFTTPELTAVETSGLIAVESVDTFQTDHFMIETDGEVDLAMCIEANELSASLEGMADVILKGSALSYELVMDGLGTISSYDLYSGDANVMLTGDGIVEVYAENSLDVVIEGIGKVYYKGTPSIQQQISGTGKIINAN